MMRAGAPAEAAFRHRHPEKAAPDAKRALASLFKLT